MQESETLENVTQPSMCVEFYADETEFMKLSNITQNIFSSHNFVPKKIKYVDKRYISYIIQQKQ